MNPLFLISNLRYTNYIGDGDSSAFNTIKKLKPYCDTIIRKPECVGHVQKGLGTSCHKLRMTWTGKKMIQWERHHGTSRVQVTKLIKLSILYKYYCGMAMGNNVGGLYGIKNSVAATLLYNCEIANKKERQQFCSCLRTSLCMWWSNKLIPGQNKYKKKLSFSLAIKSLLMPIFRDLLKETLLHKCVQ